LEKVVAPAGKDPKLSLVLINFLCAHGNMDFAHQVWVQTAAKTSPFAFSLVQPYLDRLFDLGRYGEAASVWQDLERLGVIQPRVSEYPNNLIYNGNFEHVPLNSGLDWHINRELYLSVDFSAPMAYPSGGRLRLDFTVNRNEEYEPLFQIVSVAPEQTYLLTAYVRSENITSDSGPRLRILAPACSECLNVSSATTLGTTPWHEISLKFTSGAQTRFVRVSVWRPRSRTFPTEISGQFWMERVSLRAVPSARAGSALKPNS